MADEVVKNSNLPTHHFHQPPPTHQILIHPPPTPLTPNSLHSLSRTVPISLRPSNFSIMKVDISLCRHFLHNIVGEVFDKGVDAVHVDAEEEEVVLAVGEEGGGHGGPVDEDCGAEGFGG